MLNPISSSDFVTSVCEAARTGGVCVKAVFEGGVQGRLKADGCR